MTKQQELKIIKNYLTKLVKNKAKTKQALIDAGITDKKGKLVYE